MEEIKNQSELVAEKLAGMTEDRLKGMTEDPIGEITTGQPTEGVWAGMNEDEMKKAARGEMERRGLDN